MLYFLAGRWASDRFLATEETHLEYCHRLLQSDAPIVLPHDFTAMDGNGKIGDPSAGGIVRQVGQNIPDEWIGLDIGLFQLRFLET